MTVILKLRQTLQSLLMMTIRQHPFLGPEIESFLEEGSEQQAISVSDTQG